MYTSCFLTHSTPQTSECSSRPCFALCLFYEGACGCPWGRAGAWGRDAGQHRRHRPYWPCFLRRWGGEVTCTGAMCFTAVRSCTTSVATCLHKMLLYCPPQGEGPWTTGQGGGGASLGDNPPPGVAGNRRPKGAPGLACTCHFLCIMPVSCLNMAIHIAIVCGPSTADAQTSFGH